MPSKQATSQISHELQTRLTFLFICSIPQGIVNDLLFRCDWGRVLVKRIKREKKFFSKIF